MEFHHSRRALLLRGGKADEADAYLVTHRPNVRYLTGLEVAEAVLVSGKGVFVFCREELAPLCKPLPSEATLLPRVDGVPLEQVAAQAIQKVGAKAIAVEGGSLPVTTFQGIAAAVGKATLKPLTGRVEALRSMKDPSEVDAIRQALRVSERAFIMLRAILREVDTELELCRQLDQLLLRAGANAPAIPSRVTVGEAAAEPMLRPDSKRVVSQASKLHAHWGAEVTGYCGIVSRSFRSPFGAPPLRKTRHERLGYSYEKVADAVRQATTAAIAAINPDATFGEVADAAVAPLTAAGLEKFVPAEIGHGVGLEPREGPFVRSGDRSPIPQGTVLVLAPQVRIPDWGVVQFSTTVVVGRDGAAPLHSPPPTDV